ncbi:MAG: Holliday junction branch migration protein RuvA [Oscillospiraceae bacterium]|nr:Holliday junction branch migration protein RuvA [Oscillospiraceae bacterium]
MFYYLNGTVAAIEPYLAVIDCSGVGYACSTSMNSLASLNIGEKVKMYTYCHVREDAFDIYGFVTQRELGSFKLLIGISGVGPKAALSILSANSPEELASAVASGNEKALTVAPGIGKKLAQRILLELKDKVAEAIGAGASGMSVSGAAIADGSKAEDVASALTVLGYTPSEINTVLKKIDLNSLTVEEAVRDALRVSLK